MSTLGFWGWGWASWDGLWKKSCCYLLGEVGMGDGWAGTDNLGGGWLVGGFYYSS